MNITAYQFMEYLNVTKLTEQLEQLTHKVPNYIMVNYDSFKRTNTTVHLATPESVDHSTLLQDVIFVLGVHQEVLDSIALSSYFCLMLALVKTHSGYLHLLSALLRWSSLVADGWNKLSWFCI